MTAPTLTPAQTAQVELASRVLSKRRLLPFVQRINPRYMAGWVHEDICRRLEQFSEDVAAGLSPRLMLLMPPRAGKSELASRMFPSWHLGRYPDHEIISCAYNVSLAMSFSRKVKEAMDDPSYQSVFDARLHPDFRSNEEWGLSNGRGGYVAAGVGGGITGKGAHCLPAGEMVSTTEGAIDIEHLYQLKSPPRVLTPFGPRRILAATRRETDDLYTLTFASGKVLRTTGKHPLYLPDREGYATVESLYGQAQNNGRLDVRVVREALPAPALRLREVGEAGVEGVLLQQDVQSGAPCDQERAPLRDVPHTSRAEWLPERKILLPGVPPETARPTRESLRGMWRGVSAEVFKDGLLRQGLRQYGAQQPDDWGRELALQGRQFLRILVRPDEAPDHGARQGVRSVPDGRSPAHPPSGREPPEQWAGELGADVRFAPHNPPQVEYDTISLVEPVRGIAERVYDLQVEDAGCFFAGQVLVGNCLIIDDPVKNAEEADSADVREKLWDWYGSTAYTRLAPGGGVLVVQTHWHDDDLAGRLQNAMAADPESDQFVVIKYPAIAEHDEYLDMDTDLIVYEPPEHGRALRTKGEALHPERYDLIKLNRIRKTIPPRFWSALYQQNPVPDDGAYFTKDMFRRTTTPSMRECNVYVAFDFAISEKKQNDYTVGVVGLQDRDDVLHVVDMVRFKSGDGMFIVEAILNLAQKWYIPGLQLGFEDGQIYRAIESLIKKRMKERGFYPSVVVLKPISDKMARARPLQGRMQQGMVSFTDQADWYEGARNEMLRFPAGVHDDQVDAIAWMTNMAVGRSAPRAPTEKPKKSWRDRVRSLGTSGGGHMAA